MANRGYRYDRTLQFHEYCSWVTMRVRIEEPEIVDTASLPAGLRYGVVPIAFLGTK